MPACGERPALLGQHESAADVRESRTAPVGPVLSHPDETRAVAEVAQRLTSCFPDVAPDIIWDTVHASHERFAGSPIRDFVPVLVERMARTSLATTTDDSLPVDISG